MARMPLSRLVVLTSLGLLVGCHRNGGSSGAPPTLELLGSEPAHGEVRVDPTGHVTVRFGSTLGGDLDELAAQVILRNEDGLVIAGSLSLDVEARVLTFTPESPLPPSQDCTLELSSDLRGAGGERLGQRREIVFRTDAAPLTGSLTPYDQVGNLSPESTVTAAFSRPLDESSVTGLSVILFDEGSELTGELTLEREGRVVRFTPDQPLRPFRLHRFVVLGGEDGVRDIDGRPLSGDLAATFLTTSTADVEAPTLTLELEDLDREEEVSVANLGAGFLLKIGYQDELGSGVDLARLSVTADRPAGELPPGTELADRFVVDSPGWGTLRFAADRRFRPGQVTLTVRAEDHSGNSVQSRVSFEVLPALDHLRPFRRSQEVFVNFDADRDGAGWIGDGTPDFDQDLRIYGLATESDPIGVQELVRESVIAATLARVNLLFGRTPAGRPRVGGTDVVFRTERVPGPVTELCIGGIDSSRPGRVVGDESTNVIGRAFYDPRNLNNGDFDCFPTLGLGVFPGELFLSQYKFWEQVQPTFSTTFGDTYEPFAPSLGGLPIGEHPADITILSPDFDWNTATPGERTRYDAYTLARDRLAHAVALLIAHELGHSLGLTAPGDLPSGLEGSSGFHNAGARILDVMSAALSFEVLISPVTRFRPLNRAYLSEGLILR
ncbi:MAG: Ig-like domain-containing protein [Planctomycetota bacterium]